jgi:hypothetical protein
MKKNGAVLSFVLVLWLGACSQIQIPNLSSTSTPGTGPTVDLFQTAVAQTLAALPAQVTVAPTDTATLVPTASPTPVVAVSATPSATFTSTSPVTASAVPATVSATLVPANATPTATLPAGQITAIWTLAVRKYGTLPPLVPFSQVTLINKAKTEAYISLHVDLPQGGNTVIEYPVQGTIKIQAPVGFYSYVAWVGGNKMVGNFRLRHDDDLSIVLYKDKVVIK